MGWGGGVTKENNDQKIVKKLQRRQTMLCHKIFYFLFDLYCFGMLSEKAISWVRRKPQNCTPVKKSLNVLQTGDNFDQ